jgi:hypothetical protein
MCAAAAACGSKRDGAPGTDTGDDVRDALRRATDDFDQTRREFQDKAAQRMREIETDLSRLGDKLKTAAAQERERLQPLFDDLSKAKDTAAAELRDLRAAARDKWADLRASLERGMASLETRLRDALK